MSNEPLTRKAWLEMLEAKHKRDSGPHRHVPSRHANGQLIELADYSRCLGQLWKSSPITLESLRAAIEAMRKER